MKFLRLYVRYAVEQAEVTSTHFHMAQIDEAGGIISAHSAGTLTTDEYVHINSTVLINSTST